MDEYSENDGDGGEGIGKILVGKDAEMDGHDEDDEDHANANAKKHDSDSDIEDDLEDVPDTREYMPLDMQRLRSLGIGGATGGEGGYTLDDLRNMTDNDVYDDDFEEEEEEDEDYLEDVPLRDGDALVVVAKTEEDFASLKINVFDTEASNLYVHHDIHLPSFPLCLALSNIIAGPNNSTITGNYCAVGSFETGMEIWNLDVMNVLEPSLVLGGMDTRGLEEDWMRMQANSMMSTNGSGKKKKKKGKVPVQSGLWEGSHTDAVMGLSWNTVHKQVLASGSAAHTVKLWDVTYATVGGKGGDHVRPSATLTHHTDKVQSLAWHPSQGTLLATGGYDRKVCLVEILNSIPQGNHARRRCFILLDNLNSHHNTQVVAMVLAYGHRIVFRAPYYPIDGPIEFVFNTVEGFLTINMHLVENNSISLCHWTRTGIANIQTCVPYFHNCGYHRV